VLNRGYIAPGENGRSLRRAFRMLQSQTDGRPSPPCCASANGIDHHQDRVAFWFEEPVNVRRRPSLLHAVLSEIRPHGSDELFRVCHHSILSVATFGASWASFFRATAPKKLLGWFGGPGLKLTIGAMHRQLGLPVPVAFLTVATEFLGGLGLIAGLLSRVAAAGIGVIMLAAIVMVHGRNGLFLDWFGDRKGHGYEYHLMAIARRQSDLAKQTAPALDSNVLVRLYMIRRAWTIWQPASGDPRGVLPDFVARAHH
jgi:uncharacterized membrane protein YphA (DoxX/SURF4 family)